MEEVKMNLFPIWELVEDKHSRKEEWEYFPPGETIATRHFKVVELKDGDALLVISILTLGGKRHPYKSGIFKDKHEAKRFVENWKGED